MSERATSSADEALRRGPANHVAPLDDRVAAARLGRTSAEGAAGTVTEAWRVEAASRGGAASIPSWWRPAATPS